MTDNPTQAAPLCETRDLSLFWRGRAKALRILDGQSRKSDAMTLETARVYDECAAELDASLSAAAPSEGGDWVRVPREPTEAMVAGAEISQRGKRWDPTEIYRAMIAAAPPAPDADPRGGEREAPHYVRREYLEKLKFSTTIQLVPTCLIANQAEADAFCAEVWGAGGEGIILKDRNGLYQPKRSAAWLKVKKFETVDLPITDSYEGKGKYKNQLGGLITSDGKISADVGGGFSDEQRILLWQSRDTLPGKVIEIGYHEVTPDQSLRHPRFIKFRPDKKAA